MSNILSQEEIESLLNSLNEGNDAASEPVRAPTGGGRQPVAAKGAPGKQPQRRDVSCEVYDFRRPDKFSRDQLRTLQMLHETFARLAGSAMSAYLRAPVQIELISLEQVPYEEYMRSIGGSTFTIISMPPLTGQSVIEMEFGLMFSIMDRMLGGPGTMTNRTVLTDIERPLVRTTMELVFGALRTAWEGVVILNPGIEGIETSAQFVQIAPPNDIVITMLFEVRVGEQRGAMSLCIPYLVLKPVTTKLSAQRWFVAANRKQGSGIRKTLSNQVKNTVIPCSVILGNMKINTQDFLALEKGDLLKLEKGKDEEIQMFVGPLPKFNGRLGLSGTKLAFTITDLISDQ